MSEIINKVAISSLVTIDLETVIDKSTERVEIDLANNLYQGLILREKDFRTFIREHNWDIYCNKYVNVNCSADAIIPSWAYMLVMSKLSGIAKLAIFGNPSELEKEIIRINIEGIEQSVYVDSKVVIKGCSELKHPEYAFSEITRHLTPVVSSIMYGEPCSTVPVYKKKK